MAIYETIFIVHPDYTDEQKGVVTNKMNEVIKKGGGEIKKIEDWGVRKLAYLVKNNSKGHYYLFCYESRPTLVKELERNLKITEGVLKYQTIRLEKEAVNILLKSLSGQEGTKVTKTTEDAEAAGSPASEAPAPPPEAPTGETAAPKAEN